MKNYLDKDKIQMYNYLGKKKMILYSNVKT